MRCMLNGGHNRQTSMVWRSVGDTHEPKPFKVWAPKALAMIGSPADTVEDRSIVVHLKRKLKTTKSRVSTNDARHSFTPFSVCWRGGMRITRSACAVATQKCQRPLTTEHRIMYAPYAPSQTLWAVIGQNFQTGVRWAGTGARRSAAGVKRCNAVA
jgi:hypothetical protein